MTDQELVAKVAAVVSKQYHRRRPWIDAGDLYQEAALGALEALEKVDRSLPTFLNYVYTVAARYCNSYAWHSSCPVTYFRFKPESLVRLATTTADQGDPIDRVNIVPASDNYWAQDPPDPTAGDPVEAIHSRRVAYLVRGRLRELVGEDLVDVMLGEEKPGRAATRLGLNTRSVYNRTGKARDAMRADPLMSAYYDDHG